MLRVLTGRSRRLWPRLLEEIGLAYEKKDHGPLYLITPEQFTLEAELELVSRLRLPGLIGLDVLSPTRLSQRVFALAGAPQRVKIDARGKAMVLTESLRRCESDLRYYGGAVQQKGLCDRFSALIGELKRSGLTPQSLREAAGSLAESDSLQLKLLDVSTVYAQYEQRMEGVFADGEDVQEALLSRLPQSGLMEGAQVWIYGFDLISLQFLRQITLLSTLCSSVTLSLTLDASSAPDGGIFSPSRETLARLARRMDSLRLEWAHEKINTPLSVHPEIAFAEKSLFALPAPRWEKEPERIFLCAAADPYDELNRIARRMRELAMQGVPYEEMALVLGDAAGYAGALSHVFSRAQIPYHLDRKRSAAAHPLIRGLLCALSCVTQGWRFEDALDYLSCGLCPLSAEEAELLENYAIEHGLRGNKWLTSAEDEGIEPLRLRFAQPLLALQTALRDARDADASILAIYDFLETSNAYDRLEQWRQFALEEGLHDEAADCVQAWRLLMETLDQLHVLLKGARLPMKAMVKTLEAGLSGAELGSLPALPEAVSCGELGHIKLGGHFRAVFLAGLSDGVMRPGGDESLLSEEEAVRADALAGEQGAFGLRGDALARMRQMNLLDTLSAAEDWLWVSYSLCDREGNALRPAAVLSLLREIFPALKEQGGVTEPADLLYAPGVALDALGPVLRQAAQNHSLPKALQETASFLLSQASSAISAQKLLSALRQTRLEKGLSPASAALLYAHGKTSVSRLESFAQCPYSHFVLYGLRPKPRKEFGVARDETGTFYHQAMDAFTSLAANHPQFPHLTHQQCDELMNQALSPLSKEWTDRVLGDSAMLKAQGEAFCRIARRAAWTFTRQMQKSHFSPHRSEARFGIGEALPPMVLKLSNHQTMLIEGRIDRIDRWQDGEETWLRVIDYKSGGARLSPAKLLGGQQLQLMMYLTAALGAYPSSLPAGAFYARVDDPLIETDARLEDVVEAELMKALRLQGIAVSDLRVTQAMDADGTSLGKLFNKDGSPAKNANIATVRELSLLMRHSYQLSQKLADAVMQGEISARPYQLDMTRPCDFCEFQTVCGFDTTLPGCRVRHLEKLTLRQVVERLDQDA